MIEKLKHTFKHSAIYSLGNLSVKIIGLILLPVYTSHLTTAQYGILSILEITSMFLTTILMFNINSGMMRWYADTDEIEKKKSYVFTTFVFLLFAGMIFNLVAQPLARKIAVIFFKSTDFKVYFNILFLSVVFDLLNRFILSLLRIQEKSFYYIIVASVKLVVIFSLNIYFVVYLKIGVKGIILAQLLGHTAGFIVLLPFLFRNMNFSFNFPELKKILSYSVPLMFAILAGILFNMGDRYVLKFISGDSYVGLYTLAYKIAGFLNFFVLASFQNGFMPIAFKMYKKPDAKRFFSKIATYLTIILTYGALGISLFTPEFVRIFSYKNPDYWQAADYVPILTFFVILYGLRYLLHLNFHIVKKTYIVPFIIVIMAALNIAGNFFLIPYFNVYGALLSSFVSLIILIYLYYVYSQKYYNVPYEWKKIFFTIFVGIAFYALSFGFKNAGFWMQIIFKTLILAIFPLVFVNKFFLEEIELKTLKNFLLNLKQYLKIKTKI